MTKCKIILLSFLWILTSVGICNATDKKISELTALTAVANNDVVPLNDVSAGTTKAATTIDFVEGALGVVDDSAYVGNGTTIEAKTLPSCSNATSSKLLYNSSTNTFSCGTDQDSGGGGGLGANLSSSGDSIVSTTGSINFTDMTLYADSFVSTGGTMSIVDDFTVLSKLLIPAYQDCSSVLEAGEVCIDGNISGLVDAMAFMGSDGYERVNVAMRKSDIVSLTDGDTFAYDSGTTSWVPVQASIPLWDGTEGTEIFPLTSATTDFYLGATSSSSADIWLKATGAAIFNQQNNDIAFNVQGDTDDNLILADNDVVMIGTNTPTTNAKLTVSGTMAIEGTSVGFVSFGTGTSIASADPCTSAGTRVVPINSIFMKTGGILCYCDASGVGKKAVDASSCF